MKQDPARALGAHGVRREDNSDVKDVAETAFKIYEVQGSVDFPGERQDQKRDQVTSRRCVFEEER